jgi:hypothetical protein
MVKSRLDILPVAGAEVINANKGAALAQQAVGEVRTKKSGNASDKYVQGHGLCSEVQKLGAG